VPSTTKEEWREEKKRREEKRGEEEKKRRREERRGEAACRSPTATAATASSRAMLVKCEAGGWAARGLSSTASLSAWLLGGKASSLAVLARLLSSRVLVRYTSSEPRGDAAVGAQGEAEGVCGGRSGCRSGLAQTKPAVMG